MAIALGVSCWGLSAQNEKGYDPEVFALESGRGKLQQEYFGVKLSDVSKDSNGQYDLTDTQRNNIKSNILGKHLCSLQWISWKEFGTVKRKHLCRHEFGAGINEKQSESRLLLFYPM